VEILEYSSCYKSSHEWWVFLGGRFSQDLGAISSRLLAFFSVWESWEVIGVHDFVIVDNWDCYHQACKSNSVIKSQSKPGKKAAAIDKNYGFCIFWI
jgi:hypothetical protein